MSEYADGFDDGKGEKFDELMVEIVALREQVEIANKSADDQMFQKRKAEAENAALRKDASSKWAFLEWRDRAEKAEAEIAAKQARIDALMFEYCPIEMSLEQIMEWKKHQRPVQEG